MHLYLFFSVNGLRQVVKQFDLFNSIAVKILFRFIHKKKRNEHVNTFIFVQIGAFNSGFTVKIASNCRHFD